MPLLILGTLGIKDWMHLLETSNMDNMTNLIKLKETYVVIYVMFENIDYKELEKVVNIVGPFNLVLIRANILNSKEINIISPGNAFNNHPLLSIL
jgi:hypothetical protein